MTSCGTRPSVSVNEETNFCARNITTFAPISALMAVETGPGPKENEVAYGEEYRGIGSASAKLQPHQLVHGLAFDVLSRELRHRGFHHTAEVFGGRRPGFGNRFGDRPLDRGGIGRWRQIRLEDRDLGGCFFGEILPSTFGELLDGVFALLDEGGDDLSGLGVVERSAFLDVAVHERGFEHPQRAQPSGVVFAHRVGDGRIHVVDDGHREFGNWVSRQSGNYNDSITRLPDLPNSACASGIAARTLGLPGHARLGLAGWRLHDHARHRGPAKRCGRLCDGRIRHGRRIGGRHAALRERQNTRYAYRHARLLRVDDLRLRERVEHRTANGRYDARLQWPFVLTLIVLALTRLAELSRHAGLRE